MSAPRTGLILRPSPLWRRAALAVSVLAFAVLWTGGVASQTFGRARADEGWIASLFLFLAGLVAGLGARARRDAWKLAAVALLGFAVEVVGERTGLPFGEYAYTGVLRPQVFGVPVVMGCAWMALVAYTCELARRLRLPAWPAAVLAALWTTATDLVIDPLAANHFGYWRWAAEGSYYGIPFHNFAGWFATALAACRIVGPRPAPNPWAVLIGTAILLFFAAVALAHSFLAAALIGLALSAGGVFVAWRCRPGETV